MGLSKSFVIFLFISLIFGYKFGFITGIQIMFVYAIVRIIWKKFN
jgi:hypothetical protein